MNKVILVDHQDNVLGEEDKMLVHQLGLMHRAFSIFIFNKVGNNLQLLLQKRHISKYHSGGLWSNSCCGHPFLHENTKLAATRRVTEELGIQVELEKVGSFIYKSKVSNSLIEHELDHVFIGSFDEVHDNIITPDPCEVEDLKWQDVASFNDWLITDDGCKETTVWLKPAWAIVKKALFN